MTRPRRHLWSRSLALSTLVSLLCWTFSSVVWAGALPGSDCPVHGFRSEAKAEMSCCSGADAPEAPSSSEGCTAPTGKSCCCPAVPVASLGLPLVELGPASLDYAMEFSEPLVHDTLVGRTLIIPPPVF